mgnify:CR=1 FL=1
MFHLVYSSRFSALSQCLSSLRILFQLLINLIMFKCSTITSGQGEQKHITKEVVKFPNQSTLLTLI